MFTKNELNCFISLIDVYQFDGAEYTIDDVNLNKLKKKIRKCQRLQTSRVGDKKSK